MTWQRWRSCCYTAAELQVTVKIIIISILFENRSLTFVLETTTRDLERERFRQQTTSENGKHQTQTKWRVPVTGTGFPRVEILTPVPAPVKKPALNPRVYPYPCYSLETRGREDKCEPGVEEREG